MPEPIKPLVYVVDDETVIASTLAAILNISGFNAEAFFDPLAALRAAEERCPDIMITDVVMPKLNGIDLSILFKTMYPDCKVLLFSGQAGTHELVSKAKGHGHQFPTLAKPIHPTDLLDAVRSLAGFSLAS